MQTNFFSQFANLKLSGNFILNMQRQENGSYIVSALLANDQLKDKSATQVPPLLLSGFPDDLDNGFFDAIEKPVQKTNALLFNMAEHEKSLDKAKKDSLAKQNAPLTSSSSSPKRKKFDEQMKKVTDLEAKKKIGEAISAMPKEKEYPEFATEINSKLKELRGKHGTLSMFDEDEPGTNATEETTATDDEEDNPEEYESPDEEEDENPDEEEDPE